MNIKTLTIVLFSIVVSILLLNGCSGDNKKAIRTGDILPPFSGTDLKGRNFSLESHKGSPVIIRFFLIDCPYCKADTPIFNKFYEKYRKKGFEIVYINNNGTTSDEVQNFIDELDIRFPVIYDPKGKLAQKYNVKVQPLALILSPEHKLLAALMGGVSEAELAELLDQYFKG